MRRWQRFGESGAKLIWGGEAVAVRHDGRANPHQLGLTDDDRSPSIGRAARGPARRAPRTVRHHRRPAGRPAAHPLRPLLPAQPTRKGSSPASLYHHPILDRKFRIAADYPLLTDDDIEQLIDNYVRAPPARAACGFEFRRRQALPRLPGPRVPQRLHPPGRLRRLLREPHALPARDRRRHPRRGAGLIIGVRLSAFDLVPFRPDPAPAPGGSSAPASPRSTCATTCRTATPLVSTCNSRPSST